LTYSPKEFNDELLGYLVEMGDDVESLILKLAAIDPTSLLINSNPYVISEFGEIFLKKSRLKENISNCSSLEFK